VRHFGVAQWTGAEAFTIFMRDTHNPAGRTLHRMSNTVISYNATGEACRPHLRRRHRPAGG
jgi:hypothetical protein